MRWLSTVERGSELGEGASMKAHNKHALDHWGQGGGKFEKFRGRKERLDHAS